MKERAITMDADEVRATLEGRKTQLRVPVKLREFQASSTEGWDWDFRDRHGRWNSYTAKQLIESKHSPLGKPGDRLWVRETWQAWRQTSAEYDEWEPETDRELIRNATIEYRATSKSSGPWRSPVLMPRWASRIALEVTEVRLQRLQQVTEEEAIAEGVTPYTPPHGCIAPDQRVHGPGFDGCRLGDQPHRLPFAHRWDRKHGKRCPWAENRPVWVYTFRRVP